MFPFLKFHRFCLLSTRCSVLDKRDKIREKRIFQAAVSKTGKSLEEVAVATATVTGPHLAVGGADAQSRGSVKQVDSTPVLLLSRGPDGHVRQPVPVHIPQHRQSCPKAAPGVALLPSQDSTTLPLSPLQNKNSVRAQPRRPLHTQTPPSPGLISHSPLEARGTQTPAPPGSAHSNGGPR